jgi:phosphoribosylglycinamide formyltransferase-1
LKRLGVLASHRGTNFQAILDACEMGRLTAKVVIAISNNSKSEALARARRREIDTLHVSSITHPTESTLDQAICDSLVRANVDLVVTAGYMKKLGPRTLDRFHGRVINVHPSLLPKYGGQGMYGDHVHAAVLANGDSETGLTVHLVDQEYDTGPILKQRRVPVLPGDSIIDLGQRVLAEEHDLLVETLIQLVSNQDSETPGA